MTEEVDSLIYSLALLNIFVRTRTSKMQEHNAKIPLTKYVHKTGSYVA